MTDIAVHVEAGQVTQNLDRIGVSLDGVVNADIEQALLNAQYDLQQPGQPIKYPVQWDSEKQRRAYFATNGFGHGIPYERTGAYNAGWRVKQTGYKLAREFTLSNTVKYARWVGGGDMGKEQSRIHRGRWDVAAVVVKRHAEAMLVNVKQSVHDTVQSGGYGL